MTGIAAHGADASNADRPAQFSWPTRIYWEDTDAGGVVYHARYLALLERARSEWLRSLGHGQHALSRDADLVFAVRAMGIEFIKPARLDDLLQVTVRVARLKQASLVFDQAIVRDGVVLLTAQVRVAVLSASTFKPRALPDGMARQIAASCIAGGASASDASRRDTSLTDISTTNISTHPE